MKYAGILLNYLLGRVISICFILHVISGNWNTISPYIIDEFNVVQNIGNITEPLATNFYSVSLINLSSIH